MVRAKTQISRRDFVKSLAAMPVAASIIASAEKAKAGFYNLGAFWKNSSSSGFGASGVERSLRFRAATGSYLNRTPATAGDRTRFTFSAWIKFADVTTQLNFFSVGPSGATGNNLIQIIRQADGKLRLSNQSTNILITTAVYRDPAAWYHIVVAVDTNLATQNDRQQIFVNGERITALDTNNPWATQGTQLAVNNSVVHTIGRYDGGTYPFDGHMTEVYLLDGQTLPVGLNNWAEAFGQYNSNNIWVPKAYTGSFGTNGSYMNFRETGNTVGANSGIGKDSSGLGNYWVSNNIQTTDTALTTYDSMMDYPVNAASGVRPVGNYCTLNTLDHSNDAGTVFSNANLQVYTDAGGIRQARGTIAVSSGKWYYECSPVTAGGLIFGFAAIESSMATNFNSQSTAWGYHQNNGYKYNGSGSAYGTNYNTGGPLVGVALDLDNGAIYFHNEGVWQTSGDPTSGAAKTGAAFTNLTNVTVAPAYESIAGGGRATEFNFGQRPFAYTPPSGFKALCTANLPTPVIAKPKEHFAVTTYVGNSSTKAISGLQFKPDFVWIKNRDAAYSHALFDSVRGVNKRLWSDSTTAEAGGDGLGIDSFNGDGFTMNDNSNLWNMNAINYVAWMWKAGGAGVANNQGSISSVVSANPTAGFSIVTYTGTGANGTIGHGLGSVPQFILVKGLTFAQSWCVYHSGNTATPEYDHLVLDATNATISNATSWNNTKPTSTVIHVGGFARVNLAANQLVAYCFAEVPGFSKFGSYVGNGNADGPFVWCGFRPKYIMYKRTDTTANWIIWDSLRDPSNVVQNYLTASSNGAESVYAQLDILSNGFKHRGVGAGDNALNGTYIFIAFAEYPFALNCRAR